MWRAVDTLAKQPESSAISSQFRPGLQRGKTMSINRYWRNSFFKVILTLGLAGVFSGCVVSFTNPLPASQPTRLDERLLGKWEGTDEHGNNMSARFERGSKRETVVSLPGLGDQDSELRMVSTSISGTDYMILRVNDPQRGKDYVIGRYSIADDKLTVCLLNADKVKQAIKRGELKGGVDSSQWGGAVITESPRRIMALLKSPRTQGLFTCLNALKKTSGGG